RCDDGLEARLAKSDHVDVALDHDGTLLLRDRGASEVQSVEQRALAEELALGRVDVLPAQRVVVAQLACLEPDDAAAGVGEWEHEPHREVVVASGVDETGGAQVSVGEALRLGLDAQTAPW